jgi:hypothetical protein
MFFCEFHGHLDGGGFKFGQKEAAFEDRRLHFFIFSHRRTGNYIS